MTKITSSYEKQAADFLAANNLTFTAVLVGDDCPKFCEDALRENRTTQRQAEYMNNKYPRKTHIHGKHYRCAIKDEWRGSISFDFWNSYADEEFNALGTPEYRMGEVIFKYRGKSNPSGKPRTVTAYDFLACLQKNDPGTFEDFCADFGYDTDSRRAEETWRGVTDEWRKVSGFFNSEELEQLQEIS